MFMGILGGFLLSKQALARHISESWVDFFRRVLACILVKAALSVKPESTGIFNFFNRVLINDSTSLALPEKLARYFQGSGNQSKRRNAMIKIQTTLDLIGETYVQFNITPFTHNDQRAAPDILEIISAGDLIIRDLGYFVPRVFKFIISKSAYFLSRYHHNTDLVDVHGNKIDLLTNLKHVHLLDTCIYLGKEARVPVRLVAIPVPEQVANERRRKLLRNKKRDRRLNPSKEQLTLCGWEIFITNVSISVWTIHDISNAYGLRWRIEIIFKTWKSHFNLTKFSNGGREYILILIYTRLIFIVLFQVAFAHLDRCSSGNAPGSHLSLLKFAQFLALFLIMALGSQIVNTHFLMDQILKHCTYEKRQKRLNYGNVKDILLS